MRMKTIYFVCSVLFAFTAQSQAQILKGKVVEWDAAMNMEMPLIGAGVYWMGTTDGTTTDAQGNFNLPLNASHSIVIASFVGFQSDTIQVRDAASFLKITLKKSVDLKEVNVQARQGTTTVSTLSAI